MKKSDLQYVPLVLVGLVSLVIWLAKCDPIKGYPVELIVPICIALFLAILVGLIIGPQRDNQS